MTRHILLFALLLSSSYGYTQSISFGISKSELINIEGAPDKISDTGVIYSNFATPLKLAEDKMLPVLTITKYLFNSSDELAEKHKTYIFTDSNIAKNKINNLLKSAKQKYLNSGLSGNEMVFGSPNSYIGYALTLVPQKLDGFENSVREKFVSIKHFD